jgi:hypothetical protein
MMKSPLQTSLAVVHNLQFLRVRIMGAGCPKKAFRLLFYLLSPTLRVLPVKGLTIYP